MFMKIMYLFKYLSIYSIHEPNCLLRYLNPQILYRWSLNLPTFVTAHTGQRNNKLPGVAQCGVQLNEIPQACLTVQSKQISYLPRCRAVLQFSLQRFVLVPTGGQLVSATSSFIGSKFLFYFPKQGPHSISGYQPCCPCVASYVFETPSSTAARIQVINQVRVTHTLPGHG